MHGEAELKKSMEKLNNFLPNFKFTYQSSKKRVVFLDLNVSLENDLKSDSHLLKNFYLFASMKVV